MIRDFVEMMREAKARPPRTIVVAGAQDETVIGALADAHGERILKAILVGSRAAVEEEARKAKIPVDAFEIADVADEGLIASEAVRLVREGRGHLLMKGFISTPTLLKAVLDKENGLRTGRTLSHVAVVEVDAYPKLILATDAGMNIRPDLKTKIDLIENAVWLATRLGVEKPKIAVLGAIETVNPDMPETLDAAALAKMAERGQIRRAIIDGPLALDVAISREAAEHKRISSPVAGDADVLLFPDITSGNATVKSMIYFAAAKVGGLIVGARAPIVLLSRADTREMKMYSMALGAYCAT
jgi:phosphate butyryltransferase